MIEKTKKLNVVSQEELTQIKVAMIGDSGSGKSSFIRQLQKVPFCSSHQPTLGVDTFHHYIEGKGCQTHLTFWDFSGKLDFIDIRNQFYRESQVVLLFADLGSKKSAESIDYWIREAKDNGGSTIFIAGSKKDIKKGSQTECLAKERGCVYVEISSKNGEGVNELISKIMNACK